MKWITTLTLMALLPLTSSAMTISASYVNNTTDNDAVSTGDALTGASAIGSAASELTTAGTSTSAQGARFVGANSGCGDSSGSRVHRTIAQSVDITVTWTIVAEAWEEYSISLTPKFHALLNIEDGQTDEPGDTASQVISGLSGKNVISLQYTTTATATWDQGATAGNNRTADAVLWGMDGTLHPVTWYTDGFDNYGSSSARDADGLFVDAVVTLDVIPEPATVGLLGLSSLLILGYRRFFGKA